MWWWLIACSYIDDAKDLLDVPVADCAQQSMWYADDDGDGAGDPRDVFVGCSAPAGYIEAAGDCADADPASLACPEDTGPPDSDPPDSDPPDSDPPDSDAPDSDPVESVPPDTDTPPDTDLPPDTGVPDTGVPDTDRPPDTGVPDTDPPEPDTDPPGPDTDAPPDSGAPPDTGGGPDVPPPPSMTPAWTRWLGSLWQTLLDRLYGG